eukprot:Lithocolla_globosa_v1_NODE_2721_length_1892_cov_5.194883.p2 type:complete len:112 gc:universal NODE_2721_length_1892_cov_5.194883:672-1007(+)
MTRRHSYRKVREMCCHMCLDLNRSLESKGGLVLVRPWREPKACQNGEALVIHHHLPKCSLVEMKRIQRKFQTLLAACQKIVVLPGDSTDLHKNHSDVAQFIQLPYMARGQA